MIRKLSIQKKNKYNRFVLQNILISLMISAMALVVYMFNISSNNKIQLFGMIGFFILIWGIVGFYNIKKTNINPYTFFFICYMLFSYGQILLYVFGIQHSRYDLINIYTSSEILSYCIYFIISTVFFLLGAFSAIRKDVYYIKINYQHKERNIEIDLLFRKSVKIVAWILFLIVMPLYVYSLADNVLKAIKFGYRAIYISKVTTPITNIIEELKGWFVPSVLFLLVIYKNNSRKRNIFLLIIFGIIIGGLIIGRRGEAMSLVLSVVFLWDSEIRSFSNKNKVFTTIFLLFLIVMLPIIATYRGMDNKTISGLINAISTLKSKNPLVDIIAELGFSMQPWLMVKELIPSIFDFKLGQSYVASLMAIIPSILFGGYSFTKYANLAHWLMETLKMDYGPGFSMHAEAYYNFGWLGIPFMFVIGYFYYKLLSNNFIKGSMIKYKNVLSAIALYLFIMNIRSSMYLTIRNEVYIIILPIILIYTIFNILKKRYHSSKY